MTVGDSVSRAEILREKRAENGTHERKSTRGWSASEIGDGDGEPPGDRRSSGGVFCCFHRTHCILGTAGAAPRAASRAKRVDTPPRNRAHLHPFPLRLPIPDALRRWAARRTTGTSCVPTGALHPPKACVGPCGAVRCKCAPRSVPAQRIGHPERQLATSAGRAPGFPPCRTQAPLGPGGTQERKHAGMTNNEALRNTL